MKKIEKIRMQLEINGEPICISGLEGFGVLNAIINWIKRNPIKFDPTKPSHHTLETFGREELHLEFGGLNSDTGSHYSWHRQELNVGDVVSIRILGPGEADDPKQRNGQQSAAK